MARPKETVTSFSGSDMLVYFIFPNARPIYIGTASTLTYSTYRETKQARALGRISTKGITRGPRTVGGTLIFTVINQHVVNDIMDELKEITTYASYGKMKPDELPPFDIVVSFANEYGQSASKVIYGAIMVDDGMVLSIEDMFTENTITYIARDIQHMKDTNTGRAISYESSYKFRGNIESLGKFQMSKINSSASFGKYIERAKILNDKYK